MLDWCWGVLWKVCDERVDRQVCDGWVAWCVVWKVCVGLVAQLVGHRTHRQHVETDLLPIFLNAASVYQLFCDKISFINPKPKPSYVHQRYFSSWELEGKNIHGQTLLIFSGDSQEVFGWQKTSLALVSCCLNILIIFQK